MTTEDERQYEKSARDCREANIPFPEKLVEQFERVAKQLNEDGIWLVARVQELIRSMGGKPRRTSFRRRALARILVHGAPITGPRPALRLIRHAEETVARWYAQYALFLVRIGDHERAQAFEDLRAMKIRHAQTIGAWVDNIGRGHGRSF